MQSSDVVLETQVLVSRLSFNVLVSVLVLDPSSLGSWSQKFGTMYETTTYGPRSITDTNTEKPFLTNNMTLLKGK